MTNRQAHIRWMSRLTRDDADWHYRHGNISQDDYEAYLHVWETAVPRLSVIPGPAPTDNRVLVAVGEIKEALGLGI